ncbi:MAG: hypothetical protein ACK4SX_05065 [Alcanivoracaceae bacterium]
MKAIMLILMMIMLSGKAASDEYHPNLDFSVEGAGLEGSLTFISGALYSIHEYHIRSMSAELRPFPCFIDSSIRMDIALSLLNQKLVGDVDAESVVKALFDGLVAQYSC